MEDYLTLTTEEKQQSIRSRIKNLQFSKYDIEIGLRIEGTPTEENQYQIDDYNARLAILNAQEAELVIILAELSA